MATPSVPLLDLEAQHRTLKPAVEATLRDVCERQQFILGPQVACLEERIAAYCGTPHAVGLSSGTDALLAAATALGIGAGDEVLLPAYTFFATAGAIARLGARPVFCDIEPDGYGLDPRAVGRWLERTCRREHGGTVNATSGAAVRAIVPVHLFGRTADMAALSGLAVEWNLALIEDAAQAIGSAAADGRRAGSIGDAGCYSFYPTKNLGAFGDAGMCVTGSGELARRLRALRVHGAGGEWHHDLVGGNFRLDELQAAVLNVKLDHLEAWTERRQELARRYSKAFAERQLPVRLPREPSAGRHVFNQYVIETESRDELRAFLAERRIATAIYYRVPLHLQPCFGFLEHREGDFPVAESAARRSLALPIYPEMSREQQDSVVDGVAQFFDGSCR